MYLAGVKVGIDNITPLAGSSLRSMVAGVSVPGPPHMPSLLDRSAPGWGRATCGHLAKLLHRGQTTPLPLGGRARCAGGACYSLFLRPALVPSRRCCRAWHRYGLSFLLYIPWHEDSHLVMDVLRNNPGTLGPGDKGGDALLCHWRQAAEPHERMPKVISGDA
jgi:hypothetical protein